MGEGIIKMGGIRITVGQCCSGKIGVVRCNGVSEM